MKITLTNINGRSCLYRFFMWVFWRLLDLNRKNGWLESHESYVYDCYDMNDVLGSRRSKGRFIETYSCEMYSQRTIKTRFLTVDLFDE